MNSAVNTYTSPLTFGAVVVVAQSHKLISCLLYTSDAADE